MYMLVMVVWLVYVLWHGSKVVASLKAENPEAKDPEIEAVVGKMKWKRAGIILAALLVMATAGLRCRDSQVMAGLRCRDSGGVYLDDARMQASQTKGR